MFKKRFPQTAPDFQFQILSSHNFLRQLPGARLVIAFTLAIVCAGCATTQTNGATSSRGEQTPALTSGDLQKARTPLARIEPSVSKPTAAANIAPLSDRSTRQIATAKELMNDQRYTEAALELEKALRYDPNHPTVQRALAQLHWAAGNTPRAKQHASEAIRLNPDDAVAQYISGRAQLSDADVAAAIVSLRTAKLCSDYEADATVAALCTYYLGESLNRDGYLEAALTQYEEFEKRAAQLGDLPAQSELALVWQRGRGPVNVAKADLLEKLGRFSEAADALSVFANEPKEHAAGVKRYVQLLAKAKRFDEALKAAGSLDSTDPDSFRLTLEVYRLSGKPERAIDELRARLNKPDADPQSALLMADLLQELKRDSEIATELRRYLDSHPKAYAVRERLIDELIQRKAWADVLLAAAGGLEHSPEKQSEIESKLSTLTSEKSVLESVLAGSREGSAQLSYLRGFLLAQADRGGDAETWYRKSLDADKKYIPARAGLAKLFMDDYRYDDALKIASRPDANVVEDARLEFVLGQIYDRLDDGREAEAHFRAALEADRTDVDALLALARLARRSGDLLQAQQHLQALLKQDPANEAGREALAFVYLDRSEVNAALKEVEELSRTAKTPTTRVRAKALVEQTRASDFDAYRNELFQAMKEYKPDAATWIAIAETYIGTEENKTRDAFAEALKLEPKSEEALIGLKDAERRLLNFESASTHLNELLRRRPNRHQWRLELIDLQLAMGEMDSAIQTCRLQTQRTDLDARILRAYQAKLIDVLDQSHRDDDVIETINKLRDSGQDKNFWTMQLGRVLEDRKKSAEAAALYEAVWKEDSRHPTAWRDFVFASADAGKTTQASQQVLERLYDDPENEGLIAMLVRVQRSAKRWDDGTELILNRLVKTDEREGIQNWWIELLDHAEQYDRAIDLIEKLLDEAIDTANSMQGQAPDEEKKADFDRLVLKPNSPPSMEALQDRVHQLRQILTQLLMKSERSRDAERMLLQWLEQSRDARSQFDYLRLLSAVHQLLGNDDQAQEAIERALAVRPDKILFNDVAYGWINRGKKLSDAEKMIRVALADEPQSAAFLDTYGWLMYKKGEYSEAVKWLTRAIKNAGNPDGVLHDHLGDAYWRQNQKSAAVEQWSLASELITKLKEKEISSTDERRVRQFVQQKIDNAKAGRDPAVAPIGEK